MNNPILRTCPRLEEQYRELRHKSGLRVLVCSKAFRTYHAALTVPYGSMDRFAGGTLPMGTAHFLEHKMFQRDPGRYGGSDTFDDDFAALGAESNAYTSYDRTVYYFSCSDHFPEALESLVRMVSELYVTKASVSRERQIIGEEIRMNADDPWERCYAETRTALFGRHPMQEEVCGSEASLRRITPAVLETAFRRFYRPERMVLTVCGGITPEEVLDVLDRVWNAPCAADSPIEADPPSSLRFKLSRAAFTPRVTVRKETARPLFSIGIKDPSVPVGAAALLRRDLTMSILCEMLFSRAGTFYDTLFEEGLIGSEYSYGSSVGASLAQPSLPGYGYYDLSGESDRPEAVLESFTSYVEALKKTGLDPRDFSRAKRILYADFVASFDSAEDIASILGSYAVDGLCAYGFFEVAESITQKDVQDLFEETFHPSRYSLSVVLPTEWDPIKNL